MTGATLSIHSVGQVLNTASRPKHTPTSVLTQDASIGAAVQVKSASVGPLQALIRARLLETFARPPLTNTQLCLTKLI